RNFLPDGVPAHWSVYYATDDADASLALVRKLGGAVVTGAEDTPYGRLATASDPTGAVFKLRQAPSASWPPRRHGGTRGVRRAWWRGCRDRRVPPPRLRRAATGAGPVRASPRRRR